MPKRQRHALREQSGAATAFRTFDAEPMKRRPWLLALALLALVAWLALLSWMAWRGGTFQKRAADQEQNSAFLRPSARNALERRGATQFRDAV